MHSYYECSTCNSYPEFSYCDTQFCYCSKPSWVSGFIVFVMFLGKITATLGVLLVLSGYIHCAASQNCEEMVSTLVLPLLERMEGILKNIEATLSSQETTTPSGNLSTADSGNSATAALDNFVTSARYANSRMLTSNQNFFQSRLISKEISLIGARKNCSLACNKIQACQAFNLYEANTHFVCELIADNLWTNRSKLAFLSWTGGNVWEKKSTGKELAYVDSKYKPGIQVPCEVLKPGCSGNWPHCFNCVKHCMDSFARYPYQSRTPQNDEITREFTLWPDGDQPFSVPVFGVCFEDRTFFLRRDINLSTNQVVMDYRISLEDMSRFSRLNAYPVLEFAFNGPNITNVWRSYRFEYDNWTIDAKGMLANMTFHSKSSTAIGDLFNLRDLPLKPTPFVTVNDDVYGCGSFWQLNDKYASLCPGGMVNMMGNVKFDRDRKIVNTGLSLPQSVLSNEMIDYAHIRIRS